MMQVLVWLGLWVLAESAGGGAADRPIHKERLEYDPAARAWVEDEPPVPGTPDGDLRLARGEFAQGHNDAAYRRVKRWIKTYGELDERYPAALILQAEVEIARKDYYKAHKRLQEFLNEYAGTEYAQRAVELEFVIAEMFLSGVRRKFLGLPILKADDIGISILDDLSTNYPETNMGERALKTKADYYYRKGEFPLAELEYGTLIKEFPRSRYYRYAMRRGADATLASFGGVDYDDAPLIEAEERYRDYLAAYPGSAEQEGIGLILEDIRARRAEKEYVIGRYYERTAHSRAAAYYYRSTVEHWSDTVAATRAQDRLGKMQTFEVPGEVSPPPPPGQGPPTLLQEEAPP